MIFPAKPASVRREKCDERGFFEHGRIWSQPHCAPRVAVVRSVLAVAQGGGRARSLHRAQRPASPPRGEGHHRGWPATARSELGRLCPGCFGSPLIVVEAVAASKQRGSDRAATFGYCRSADGPCRAMQAERRRLRGQFHARARSRTACSFTGRSGMVMRKVAPSVPSASCSSPPWARTSSAAMTRPSPVPPSRLEP